MSKKFSDFLAEQQAQLKDMDAIDKWLQAKFIQFYTIGNNGVVDVDGEVYLAAAKLHKIPVKFGKIKGYFNISHNPITSLEFCPKHVVGYLNCSDTNITSLKGAPDIVEGSIYLSDTPKLKNLEGCPFVPENTGTYRISLINSGISSLEGHRGNTDRLNLERCKNLTSFHDVHKHLNVVKDLVIEPRLIKSHVLGILMINGLRSLSRSINHSAKIEWFSILEKYVGKSDVKNAVIDCQNELIDAGLDDYAQL